jgi:HNH endonuclease
MFSREARITLLSIKASVKYRHAIIETAALLEELIALVKAVDPVPKREIWPARLITHLAQQQNGICPECQKDLPSRDESAPHVDHVVPWVQGGDNGEANLRVLHAQCNLRKGDACNPDDVLRHLQSRLLNLRATLTIGRPLHPKPNDEFPVP